MSRDGSTTAWQVREIISGSAALLYGAGGYFYQFRSPCVSGVYTVVFSGAGIGAGAGVSGSRPFLDKEANWTNIQARTSFSMNDLDGAQGQIIAGSVPLIFDVVEISAWKGRNAAGQRVGEMFWGTPVSGGRVKKWAKPVPKVRLQFSKFVGKWKVV
jgi:hypothetical protein